MISKEQLIQALHQLKQQGLTFTDCQSVFAPAEEPGTPKEPQTEPSHNGMAGEEFER